MHPKAKKYIDQLNLKPHPEGGYFIEVYRSGEIIFPEGFSPRFGRGRSVSTSIYFLLDGNQLSNFHKLKSDEIWHFYDGCGVKIYVIKIDGRLKEYKLGKNPDEGEKFQIVIKNNNWFAAELIDNTSFSLVGCTVSPGFDFEDFELAEREKMIILFPQFTELIEKFTAV